VEGCNFKIKCPEKLRPAGDYWHLKVSTLKVNEIVHVSCVTHYELKFEWCKAVVAGWLFIAKKLM